MSTLSADPIYPNTTGWQERHELAIRSPRGLEVPLVAMLKAWSLYAQQYYVQFESKIGNQAVLGPAWKSIGDSLRTLLDGETGDRLDRGTIDKFILDTMKENAVDTTTK